MPCVLVFETRSDYLQFVVSSEGLVAQADTVEPTSNHFAPIPLGSESAKGSGWASSNSSISDTASDWRELKKMWDNREDIEERFKSLADQINGMQAVLKVLAQDIKVLRERMEAKNL